MNQTSNLMTDAIEKNFNSVLPLQLAAVQQHFIHFLSLKVWNEPDFANKIFSVDAVDLPGAMKIVNWMIKNGRLPEICDANSVRALLPNPGFDPKSVALRELELDKALQSVLHTAARDLGDHSGTLNLVSPSLEQRNSYQLWLARKIDDATQSDTEPHLSLEGDQNTVSLLFAELMLMINQTLVHSFTHLHHGEQETADKVWTISAGIMMHAARLTKELASRRIAVNLKSASVLSRLKPLRLRLTPEEALSFDFKRIEICYGAAVDASKADLPEKLSKLCSEAEAYLSELRSWRPEDALPQMKTPCVSFDRIVRDYVTDDAKSVSD